MRFNYLIPLFFALSISSCVSKKKYNELNAKYEDLKQAQLETPFYFPNSYEDTDEEEEIDFPKTTITFDSSKKDFGKVLSTSTNRHTFIFTNTGTEPLVISNAKGSCGCTVPEYPTEPILPGETGEISVEYKPSGQSGRQTKQITITANTNPARTILTITGDIQPETDSNNH